MANIYDKIAAIRTAVFGKDVRESLASGIEAINNEVINVDDRQTIVDRNEEIRIDNENTRIDNENDRKNNEEARISTFEANEDNRRLTFNNSEASRKTTFETDEFNRINTFNANETNRQQNEDIRIDNENIRISNETQRINNENDRLLQFGNLRNEINESIDNANEATLNTNNATINYTDVVDKTKKIYKPMVNSYSDILTTYPTPEIGWTVVTNEDHIERRWDGTEWVAIGLVDTFTGYNIVVGSTPPNNPNLIWLDSPESTRYARIFPSITQPSDINQIWWENDD
jgi:hypothetical protein